jgi:voltage-gated potassium channel
VTTTTTVGYGDISPATDLGRAVAIVVMVLGIGFLSLLIGAVSERFVTVALEDEVADVEQELDLDIEAARDELLRELRAMATRLGDLEGTVRRLSRPA